jgi:FkbM family methyltransferase
MWLALDTVADQNVRANIYYGLFRGGRMVGFDHSIQVTATDMINCLYGVSRKLALRKRNRVLTYLKKLGMERRLQAQGEVVYEYDGRRIGVDLADHVGLEMFKNGWYESLYVDFIRRHLTDPAGVFLDVGANVGNYSLALAPFFRQTLAFEPNPAVYDRLLANCSRNPSLSIRPLPVGLSARRETLEFHIAGEHNSGESSFEHDPGAPASQRLNLSVVQGDEYLSAGERVALIKIDVEGHELEVLAGLANTLRRDRPTICLEWHTELMQSRGGFEKLETLLPDDYGIVYSRRRDRIDLAPLSPPYRKKYNLIFCLPQQRLEQFGLGTGTISTGR